MSLYSQAANELHRYLIQAHWNGNALLGPDPGIRFNYRIGRYVKSYLPRLPWNDSLCYVQGQGYWILANWLKFRQTGDPEFQDIALACSYFLLQRQLDEGAWEYPNPEWRGRIATAEGTWAAIALIESYRQTQNSIFLDGVLRWHHFLIHRIGFQRTQNQYGEVQLAVNYFADRAGARVPNNTAFVLRFFAELNSVTDDPVHLEFNDALLSFLCDVQSDNGEFPYTVPGLSGKSARQHFQCFQYNAFQCLDLQRLYSFSSAPQVLALVKKSLEFLRAGLADDGHALYECGSRYRTVTYHAAVLGAAFAGAGQLGIDGYEEFSSRAFRYVLNRQRADGGFPYSQHDYFVLCDQRSYPRYLAMILYHLLTSDDVPAGDLNRSRSIHSQIS